MNDTIGARIKKVRESKGITLKQLSKISGINESVLSMIENNAVKPTNTALVRISTVLDVDISEIYSNELNKASREKTE